MKYITYDICNYEWNDDVGEAKFSEAMEKAQNEYESIYNRLPEDFNKLYQERHFHDYYIKKLWLEKKKHENFDYNMILEHMGKSWCIHYHNVKKLTVNLSLKDYCEFGDYLYGEILPVDDKTISHEFYVYDICNSIYISFESISLESIN